MKQKKKLDKVKLERSINCYMEDLVNFYGDEYDLIDELNKILKDKNADSDILNELLNTIAAHDDDFSEDDLLGDWDSFVEIALKVAKEYVESHK